MSDPNARRWLGLVVVVVAAAIFLLRGFQPAKREADGSGTPAAREAQEQVAPLPATPPAPRDAAATPGADAAAPGAADDDTGDDDAFEASAFAWAQVDLEAVRDALPDNMYWEMSAPTSDERVKREREEIRAEWNRQFGRVQANVASEQEVRDYYALRQRISADAVEFASYVLDHYRGVLPERDVGLLELARKLHLARLEEMPARLAESLERSKAHAEARRRWIEEERAFRGAQDDDAAGPR